MLGDFSTTDRCQLAELLSPRSCLMDRVTVLAVVVGNKDLPIE